jgi:hypothetical protein
MSKSTRTSQKAKPTKGRRALHLENWVRRMLTGPIIESNAHATGNDDAVLVILPPRQVLPDPTLKLADDRAIEICSVDSTTTCPSTTWCPSTTACPSTTNCPSVQTCRIEAEVFADGDFPIPK